MKFYESGTVAEILVNNQEGVEYGQPFFANNAAPTLNPE